MCPYFMLFYVFLLFTYPHIPKSGIWFTSPACRFEIMLLVFAVIFAKTFLELKKSLYILVEIREATFASKWFYLKVTDKRKSTYKKFVSA